MPMLAPLAPLLGEAGMALVARAGTALATRAGTSVTSGLLRKGVGEGLSNFAGRGVEKLTNTAVTHTASNVVDSIKNRFSGNSAPQTTPTYEPRLQNFNHGYDSSASTGAYSPGNPLN